MANIDIIGRRDCPECDSVYLTLARSGNVVSKHVLGQHPQSSEVLRRAISSHPLHELVDTAAADRAGVNLQTMTSTALVAWLCERPEALKAPLVVRGNSVVIASPMKRAQNLMY